MGMGNIVLNHMNVLLYIVKVIIAIHIAVKIYSEY